MRTRQTDNPPHNDNLAVDATCATAFPCMEGSERCSSGHFFKYTIKIDIATGVIPDIRDA